jgi:hypothetical protein
MDFYHFFGHVIRYVLATILLMYAVIYIHESTFDLNLVDELVNTIEGEYSIQIDEIDVKLALNDSTFMLKFEA